MKPTHPYLCPLPWSWTFRAPPTHCLPPPSSKPAQLSRIKCRDTPLLGFHDPVPSRRVVDWQYLSSKQILNCSKCYWPPWLLPRASLWCLRLSLQSTMSNGFLEACHRMFLGPLHRSCSVTPPRVPPTSPAVLIGITMNHEEQDQWMDSTKLRNACSYSLF